MHKCCVQLHYFPTGVYTCLHPAQHPHDAVFSIPLPLYTNPRRQSIHFPRSWPLSYPLSPLNLWLLFELFINRATEHILFCGWFLSVRMSVNSSILLHVAGVCVCVCVSPSVVSGSLGPLGLQHTRLPCPSPFPGVCSNSCPLRQWYYPTISSSVAPLLLFSIFSGSFPMSRLFTSGGQSIGTSASASVVPMNIQDWFLQDWLVWSPCSPRDSQESSAPEFESINSTALSFPRRRQWHPTPVLLPGKSHGQRSLVGCSPWGH